MISIDPIPHALVPVDSAAASRLAAPNYDEFQGDRDVWAWLREAPESVLRITMAHCDVPSREGILEPDGDQALRRAAANLQRLVASPLTRELSDVLYLYEIIDRRRPHVRQLGLGGLARTSEIRTADRPEGPILRNEGIREAKARGRARLIEATSAIIGTVNHAVPDLDGRLAATLEAHADTRPPDYETVDEAGNRHRIWIVADPTDIESLRRRLGEQPEAYVADGNHRSAAAAMLGCEHFLAVFFPAHRMRIAPYNRLVSLGPHADGVDRDALEPSFEILGSPPRTPYQPDTTHRIGLYTRAGGWWEIAPRDGTWDPRDAARAIDHDIVQRHLFGSLLGIDDPADDRLTFVGANRDAAWLQGEVDAGRADLAVTLPAITMDQFIAVCRQGAMMPPKSTWFEPKIRSGLVIALLD